jgi:predicted MFS family arabinose efflux permease
MAIDNLVNPVTAVLPQRRLMYLAGAMGFLMYGIGFSVPLLRRDMEISRSVAAIHNIGFAITMSITSLIIPKFISRYSPTLVMKAGWAITTASIAVYSVGNSLWITVPAMSMAGLGGTLFNNTNAATVGQDSRTSTRLLLRQSGISTFCGATAPTIIGILIRLGVPWRATLFSIAIAVGVVAFKIVPIVPDRFPIAAGKTGPHIDRSILLLVLFSFTASLVESGTGAWILDLLLSRKVSIGSAVLLATVFSYGVASSRISFSFAERVSPASIWIFSTVVAISGLMVIITASAAPATMLGLVIASLGIGPIGALALARSAASTKGSDVGIAAFVVGAGPANGFGAWIMGTMSERSGFSTAYSLPIIFLLIATGFFFTIIKRQGA